MIKFVFICVAIGLIYVFFHPWDSSRSYRSFKNAVYAGEIERGWVPAFVPKDAYNLKIGNDNSPTEEYMEFNFRSIANMRSQINQYDHVLKNDIMVFHIMEILSKESDIQPKAKAGDHLSNYRVEWYTIEDKKLEKRDDMLGCLVINWTRKKAYYVLNWAHGPDLWWIRFKMFIQGRP